ncbi:MAG: DUF3347 domain-containing protein, partial [Calditrichaeota bacterium]|nr:DUF3347 domain-containing protein [Calditrichota bacterium]
AFDDNTRIITYTHTMRSQIDQLDQSQIVDWPASADEIKSALEFYTDSLTINESRQHFQRLTRGVIKLIQNYGYSTDVFVMKCPMAFNNTGATWLQTDKDLINPYFGAEMFKCGNVLSQLYHAEEN